MDKEYQLHISITKALSPSEAPLKMKHARSVIIATHQSKSAKPFWMVIIRQPIMEHRFTAWKFCHMLHKVLREGHENAIKHSQTHKTLILEVGKMWGHLQDGVGKCIEAYTKLLVNKLEFHQKNINIPGSLTLDFNKFARNVGNDLNLYFQLCVEVFDYLEHILQVQAQIFIAINSYRMSSMTPQGQCRLAPLITLIQDSNPLYDLCVRIMFHLHDGLPHDVLMGHRNRFNDIFNKLKAFYENVRPLQYFSDVIQLPHLPENAPNFYSEVDLGNYTAPVMVLPQEPESEPTIGSLVDLANVSDNNSQGNSDGNAVGEKDLIIRQLTGELAEKQMALDQYSDLAHQINNYQVKNENLEQEIAHTKEVLQQTLLIKDNLEQKLGEVSGTIEQKLSKMSNLEEEVKQSDKKVKQVEDKFDKIKTMYTKLREEHIGLLRIRNEDSKQLANEKKEIQQLKEEIEILNKKLLQLEETEELNSSLKSKSLEYEYIITKKEDCIENLNKELVELKEQLKKNQEDQNSLLQLFEEQKAKLEEDNRQLFSEKQDNERLKLEIDNLKEKLEHQISKTEEIDCSLKTKTQQFKDVMANKDQNLEQLNSDLTLHKQKIEKSHQENLSLIEQYEKRIKIQLAENEQIKEIAEKESNTKQQEIEKLLIQKSDNESALQDLEKKFYSINIENQSMLLDLKTAKKQVEDLNKIQKEIQLDTDNIIASIIELIKHSLNTDFTYKVFEANLIIPNAETNIDAVLVHIQSVQDEYKNHIIKNTKLTSDFVKSNIQLIFTLRTLHENTTLIGENTTDIEKAQILRSLTNEIRHNFIYYYQMLLDNSKDEKKMENMCQENMGKLNELKKLLLIMRNSFTENLNIADMLQQELKEMDKMIEEAAQKMLEIQQNSKSKNEGIKLEVNDKILDSCTNLMQCIINLIKKSRDLQSEIVARGKGTFTEKEFYKRNSQWTEGLISASKSVAKGANYLVDAANKAIVLESNECFEIIVAAQEIAASTAQLVIASKVKANKDSQKLIDLTKASRDVSLATGSVVATVKDGCNKLEYKNEIDMTKLTTSQKKTMEMEMHIKVLQLEQALDNERQNLMSFRKKFYQSSDDD